MFGLIQFEVAGRLRSRYTSQAAQEFAEGMRSAAPEKADGVCPPILPSANRSFGFAEYAKMKKKMAQATRSRCTFPDCGNQASYRWQNGNPFSAMVRVTISHSRRRGWHGPRAQIPTAAPRDGPD